MKFAAGTRIGGSGLLVDEELERAIRNNSATALEFWLGVGTKAVSNQVGEDSGIPYLAMQPLLGETLESRLQQQPSRPAADVNGDGFADIITGAGPGGGPHVRVFSGANPGNILASFMVYDPDFRGGMSVAGADVNGDVKADIITGGGPGRGPHVRIFSGASPATERFGFFTYSPAFAGGVFLAAGDVGGDANADIVTSAGPVKVFSNAGALLQSFFAYEPGFTGGVRVAAADVDGEGRADIITGAGPGGGPHVKVFRGTDRALLRSFFAFDPAFNGGVFVG